MSLESPRSRANKANKREKKKRGEMGREGGSIAIPGHVFDTYITSLRPVRAYTTSWHHNHLSHTTLVSTLSYPYVMLVMIPATNSLSNPTLHLPHSIQDPDPPSSRRPSFSMLLLVRRSSIVLGVGRRRRRRRNQHRGAGTSAWPAARRRRDDVPRCSDAAAGPELLLSWRDDGIA